MSQSPADDEIDLKALLLELLASWKLITLMVILGALIGVLYVKNTVPIYSSSATIQIDKKSSGVSALGENVASLLQVEASPAQTEIEIIKSRMVLMPVIRALNLDIKLTEEQTSFLQKYPLFNENQAIVEHDERGVHIKNKQAWIVDFAVPEYFIDKPFSITQKSKGKFILTTHEGQELTGNIGKLQVLRTSYGDIRIFIKNLPSDGTKLILTKISLPKVVSALTGSFSVVEQGKQTGILVASLKGTNQDQITDTLSRIVLSYKKQNEDRSSEETTKTLAFMSQQLPELKKKLNDSEAEFNKFREQNATVDINKESELIITENVAIQKNLKDLELKKAELVQRYTEEYPLVQQINAQIAELKSRENYLQDRIKVIPEVQRKFLELSSDVKINSEIYLTMLKNYEQLQIVRSGQIGYVRIIDLPLSTHEAIAPKKTIIILLATFLGGFLGVVIALIRSLFRNVVKDPDELEEKTGIPVIATVPRSAKIARVKGKKSLPLVDFADAYSVTSEAIKSLRTHLLFSFTDEKSKTIVITGASPGIGKSFISANLAVSIASTNKKVLLVDADMRLGHTHLYFGLNLAKGLSDFLENSTLNLTNVIQKTTVDNLDFMSRGKEPNSPVELLMKADLSAIFKQLSQQYDYIVVDTPPVLAASDTMILGKQADSVVFVARYGVSIPKEITHAVKQLDRAGVEVDGIVFNDTQQSALDKYNGYHYTYAYKKK